MSGTTHIIQPSVRKFARLGLGISCTLALLLGGGCAGRKVKAKSFPWSTFAYTRPLLSSLAPTSDHDDNDPLADATLEVAPPPSALVIARIVPPRPRVPVVNSSQNDADTKPEIPQIAPQLTAAEASAAQQQTSQSLSIAEHNIGAVEGKSLNAKQQDLASKVRSFMAEARDAANTGDWMRARAASKKAEVLSQELASSI
jgi:hypothetical protein